MHNLPDTLMPSAVGDEVPQRPHSSNDRKLVIVPCCGLGNRLQTLVCAQLLAEDTHRELFVNWTTEHNTCGARFEELFLPIFPALEPLPEDISCYSSIQRHPSVATARYASLLEQLPKDRFKHLRSDASATLVIFTCHQFLSYYHDPRFALRLRTLFLSIRAELVERAQEFSKRYFTDKMVGVHIRRADWRSQRTLDYYFELMGKFPGATFMVCSDEPTTVDAIRQRFANVLSFPTESLQRDRCNAIQEALIEMLLLSKTSYLIGTPGSSFSSVAQTVGGMPSNFDYGLSISLRDFKLGNLTNPGAKLLRRLSRHARTMIAGV